MNDNKLYMFIWSVIATVAITLIITLTAVDAHTTNKITEMVKGGVSPVAASCAVYSSYGDNPVCILLATKELSGE